MNDQRSGDIVDEAHENLRADRNRIERYYASILKLAEDGDVSTKVDLVESVARLSDVLIKNNAQLVELAKIRLKRECFVGNDRFSENETDDVFNVIGDGPFGAGHSDKADA